MKKRFIETGEIVSTHGIKGEVKVYPWSDSPEFLTGFKKFYTDGEGGGLLKASSARVHKSMVLIQFEGIDDVASAAAMRGKVLYIDRNDVRLQNGRYFVQDLIGCKVYDDETGVLYGKISEIFKTGANDVWRIKNGEKEHLFPAVSVFIKEIDTENETAKIVPPKGVFDEPDEV